MKKRELNRVFEGIHNANLSRSMERLLTGKTYKDLSTICLVPVLNPIPWKVVNSWWSLMTPMNQKFIRIGVESREVGDAYNTTVQEILKHPELSKWKYLLTIEHDNVPPPDGLMKLYESMDKFDAVGGLYWTKGENGQPMCYGNPQEFPRNFVPQLPPIDRVQQYNGLGMGFNLFKLEMFKTVPEPWFKTLQEYKPGEGSRCATQDLYFYDKASTYGYKFACDGRVKVGHWDENTKTMW